MIDFDSPRAGPIILGAIAALLAALAVLGITDMDDTKTNQPAGTVYPAKEESP